MMNLPTQMHSGSRPFHHGISIQELGCGFLYGVLGQGSQVDWGSPSLAPGYLEELPTLPICGIRRRRHSSAGSRQTLRTAFSARRALRGIGTVAIAAACALAFGAADAPTDSSLLQSARGVRGACLARPRDFFGGARHRGGGRP